MEKQFTGNARELLSQKTRSGPRDLPFLDLPTPADIVDLRYLEDNLRYLAEIQAASGAKILFAQKSYSLYSTYPLIGTYLSGTTSSGIYEAKLAQEEMPSKELHVFSPAFSEAELDEVLSFADVVVFNSPQQWQLWRDKALAAKSKRSLSFGLRLNPEYSEVEEEIYNPATPGSRLGTTEIELRKALALDPQLLDGIEGFHFHSLCEDSAETLARTLEAFEEHFAEWLPMVEGASENSELASKQAAQTGNQAAQTSFQAGQTGDQAAQTSFQADQTGSQEGQALKRSQIKWVNWGGGHLITRAGYDAELLIRLIQNFKKRYACEVYLEPGEAIPLDCGWLMGSVLDTLENQMRVAILDVSASCHMPDVLEMPYRPRAFLVHPDGSFEEAGEPGCEGNADPKEGDSDGEATPKEAERSGQGESAPKEGSSQGYIYRLGGATCLAGDIIGDYSFSRPLKCGDRIVFCDIAIYSHVKRNHFNGMPLPNLYTWDGREARCIRKFSYKDFKSMLGE